MINIHLNLILLHPDFTKNYFCIKNREMTRLAIFASGRGSNAENLIQYFNENKHPLIKIGLIVSNKHDAGVVEIARNYKLPYHIIQRENFLNTHDLLKILEEHEIDFIILAGFLWLVPAYLLNNYQKKIINIHPALLPKYGGKGMYGNAVHKAVADAGEKFTGISIHYVNDHFDEGEILFQAECEIEKSDSPEIIAEKVHRLEHEYYPKVIESLLTKGKAQWQ
jgi:phosphoribosylglycinamide formyltransferase 1